VRSEDLLSVAQVAAILRVSEDWVEGQRFRLPCEVKVRDGSFRVRRRDLPYWVKAAHPREIREPVEPTRAQLELMRRCQATAERFGEYP
jgi:hypothetical protein